MKYTQTTTQEIKASMSLNISFDLVIRAEKTIRTIAINFMPRKGTMAFKHNGNEMTIEVGGMYGVENGYDFDDKELTFNQVAKAIEETYVWFLREQDIKRDLTLEEKGMVFDTSEWSLEDTMSLKDMQIKSDDDLKFFNTLKDLKLNKTFTDENQYAFKRIK